MVHLYLPFPCPLCYNGLVASNRGTHLDNLCMTVMEFQAQCLALLRTARTWDDPTWERLEDSWTMGVLDAMCDLEHDIEEG